MYISCIKHTILLVTNFVLNGFCCDNVNVLFNHYNLNFYSKETIFLLFQDVTAYKMVNSIREDETHLVELCNAIYQGI